MISVLVFVMPGKLSEVNNIHGSRYDLFIDTFCITHTPIGVEKARRTKKCSMATP